MALQLRGTRYGCCRYFDGRYCIMSKEYLEARKEFWNCVRMAPFTLGISLVLAFTQWKPIMKAELRKA